VRQQRRGVLAGGPAVLDVALLVFGLAPVHAQRAWRGLAGQIRHAALPHDAEHRTGGIAHLRAEGCDAAAFALRTEHPAALARGVEADADDRAGARHGLGTGRGEAHLRIDAPRIDVDDVEVTFDAVDSGVLYIDITYHIRGTNDPRNLVFPFYVIPQHEPLELTES